MLVTACVDDEEARMAMKGVSPGPSPPPPSPPLPPPLESGYGGFIDEGNGAMEHNGEEHAPVSDAISSGLCSDLAKYGDLSLDEKRRIVHRISLCPEDALELLQCWTRRELLQLICAEMGEQRKYTGLTKSKMIDRLLKLVSKNKVPTSPRSGTAAPPEKTARKKRKLLQPLQKPAFSPIEVPPSGEYVGDGDKSDSSRCRNLACQAAIDLENSFCKRCSCCICHRYDENKDPSLWLVCAADEPPAQGGFTSCGLSCHLSCAVQDERCGITRTGSAPRLDVGYFCAFCKKENGLIGNLRKQLVMARDARRVDLLCKRVFLSYQILWGTERYRRIQTIVDSAANKLKKEVGPLDKVSVRMARGIVNRLVCGAEVQKLCALAIEAVDHALSGAPDPPPVANGDSQAGSPVSALGFEDSAVVVAHASSQRGSTSSGDSPPAGKRKRKTKKSLNPNQIQRKRRTKKISGEDMGDNNSVRNNNNNNNTNNYNSAPRPSEEAVELKSEAAPKSSQPPPAGDRSEPAAERRYEYCVKVIRWLECEGHMEKEFRVKFLTWFSLKATAQERRVVSAFIDVLVDEPASLVDQLLDAFKDDICQPDDKPSSIAALPPKDRLCTSLWH